MFNLIKTSLACLISSIALISATVHSQDTSSQDDDFLLLSLPAIISLNKQDTPAPVAESFALTQVKRLGGRWQFKRETTSFEDYYRFNAALAEEVTTGPDRGAGILGEAHIDQRFDFSTSEAVAVYLTDDAAWAILEPWGPPRVDLGSILVFQNVGNRINASHFFYIPSTSALSTGIDTPSTGVRLSSTFKQLNNSNPSAKTSLDDKINALTKMAQEQQTALSKASKQTLSPQAETAKRALLQINK